MENAYTKIVKRIYLYCRLFKYKLFNINIYKVVVFMYIICICWAIEKVQPKNAMYVNLNIFRLEFYIAKNRIASCGKRFGFYCNSF